MLLTTGQTLHNNRYRIAKLIGQGGFGAVYRAWDTTLNQPVALKVNLDTSQEAQRQFEREAQLVAGLRHPNLPRVIDHFFIPGQGQYLVMDYVEGNSVAELLAAKPGQPLREAEVLPWLQQVCAALGYLHTRQPPIVHRDIKPENIIITPTGQAMLVDFGISKIYDAQLATTQGARAVTPGYSPPEQYGAGKTDARTDIYALGATLYRMLTGVLPPPSVDIVAGATALTPPRQLSQQLSPATEQAILQAMSVNMSQRFENVAALLAAVTATPLVAAIAAPAMLVSSPPPPKPAATGSGVPNWIWGLGGILLLVLLVLGLGQINNIFVAPEEVVAEPTAEEPAEEVVAKPTAEEPAEEASGDKVQIRWFVGLGTGTSPEQIAIQEQVVADFNASQDAIELVLEVVPYDAARDTLSIQIASGVGPDIIGPVGVGGSNNFYGQFLDVAPLVESTSFDTSIFDPALLEMYQAKDGLVGLPFAVFPSAVYFIPEMFDNAGLDYPPQVYGEQYELNGEMVDWNWETITEIAKLLTVDVNGLNSTEDGFDATQIVQVGYEPQWQSAAGVGTFIGGAAKIYEGETLGEYVSTIPDSWKEAWRWWHDGMYGDQPYIANGALAAAPEFGNYNPFNSGKVAMGLTQIWYTCCLAELRDAGVDFQMGISPMLPDGTVQGRIDADTFLIWSGTQNPEAAFEVLTYLITTGGDKLLPIYGAMPAIAEKTDAFFDAKGVDYPLVTAESWDVFVQGLAYPDVPSAEQYLPNPIEAYDRLATFGDLLKNTEDVDFDAEFNKLQEDLTVIYNNE